MARKTRTSNMFDNAGGYRGGASAEDLLYPTGRESSGTSGSGSSGW